jgi:hypothetical protein
LQYKKVINEIFLYSSSAGTKPLFTRKLGRWCDFDTLVFAAVISKEERIEKRIARDMANAQMNASRHGERETPPWPKKFPVRD